MSRHEEQLVSRLLWPFVRRAFPIYLEIAKAFLKAGEKFGYKIVDYNDEEQIGFSFIQANLDSGARCSAAKAYLQVNRLEHCDSSKGDETF